MTDTNDLPRFPLDIVIVAGGMPFHGNTLEESSLGGSETAVICLARELAKLGHEVTVFCRCPAPGKYDSVSYADLAGYETYVTACPFDVLVASRDPGFLDCVPHAKLNYLWMHDLALHQRAEAFRQSLWQVDGVVLLSDFQVAQYKEVYDLPDEIIVRTRNGIDPADFAGMANVKRRLKTLFYAARPERGLWHLVRPGGIMERLGHIDPEIRLEVCGYDNTRPQMADQYRELWDRIEALPNCHNLGALTKAQLYRQLAAAGLYVYPTGIVDEFREISCIAAMESQACGTPIITTKRGALPETVGQAGVLLDVGPRIEDAFVTSILEIIGRPDLWLSMSKAGQKQAEAYGWPDVAREWDALFGRIFAQRTADSIRLARHFVHTSDVMAAREVIRGIQTANSGSGPSDEVSLRTLQLEILDQWPSLSLTAEDNQRRLADDFEDSDLDDWRLGRFSYNDPRLAQFTRWLTARPKYQRARLLDLGCGHGGFAVALSNAFPGMTIVGVDVNPHVVECAQKLATADAEHPDNLTFKVVGHDWLSRTTSRFELVLCQEMLEHLPEPWTMADLLERPVKKGGRVIVTLPIDFWDSEAHRSEGLIPSEHLWNFERRDLHDMLSHKPGFDHSVIALNKPLKIDASKCRGHHFLTWKPGGPPAQEIDWARKLAVQNPRQTLSVCLITRDAEDQLHRTLKSVRAVADEIIVADTGSQDSTQDIARAHGARIVNLPAIEPGVFGFDDARNASIEMASGDWILWIDADEVILGPNFLGKYLRPNVFRGYALRQHHFSADPPQAAKIDLPVRLFRNFRGIRFYGKIHEHPETDLNQSVIPTMLLPDVNLGHDGYLDEAARRGRFRRNLAFLEWDRQVNPDRVLGWFFELRDFWNMARFELERTGGLVNDTVRLAAEKVISIYQDKFLGRGQTHMHLDGLKFYSQCNRILGQGFEARVACHLQSPNGVAGFDTASEGGRDAIRFATVNDFEVYMNQQVRASLAQIRRRWA